MRVLVVDDSAPVRARLAEMLREVPGIGTVDEAAGGDEAIGAIRAQAPDVVILDLHMPRTNGFGVLACIKLTEPPPLVIVLTNQPSEHHRRQCLAQGAAFFFDKSKHFGRVVDAVTESLARARQLRPRDT